MSRDEYFVEILPRELSQGLFYVRAPACSLLYAHFPPIVSSQISIIAQEDLSSVIPYLIQHTSSMPKGGKAARDLEAAITFLLQDTIFQQSVH